MAKAACFHETGGPDVLRYEDVEVGDPGQIRLRHEAISQADIPEYQVRWRWKPNSIAMWDNRCTLHYAVMDYTPCNRKMERAGIIGDRPY